MKRTSIFIITAIVVAMGALVACHENIIDETDGNTFENIQTTITGNISSEIGEPDTYDGYDIICAGGDTEINNGSFQVNTYINENIQTFVVADNSDNVYLISRTSLAHEKNVTLNVRTTALALVTMHPLFSPVKAEDYNDVLNIVTASSKFEDLYVEVEKAVIEKRNIFDTTNESLLIALSNLMEDISRDVNDDDFSETLDEIVSVANNTTRAIYENPKVYPFHADITGNVLTLRNIGLTPSYYGSVREANGQETPFSVPARADYGGMDLFKENIDEFMLGDPRTFTFTQQGSYRFNLSRMNSAATADFYLRLANSLLTSLGLDLGNDAIQEAGNMISRAMINAGSGVNDRLTEPMEWVGIAYGAIVEWMKQDYWEAIGKGGIIRLGNVLSRSLNFYNKIKGVFNASMRLAHALSAPEEVNFCLCYYDNEISTCSEATLYEVSGNEQQGYANQKLLLPLVVRVETLGDDGIYRDANTYHRIKFEVVNGGGNVESELVSADNDNQASTYWTLGEEGEQKVKATVVDIITDKEISDPVYFTADLNSAEITIRLDWSKHSCNTDIDLHVVDPNGERICWYQMTSSSGGYLDRDDTVGPGPEHIRWSSAPVGTYKIYVHYYPNEAEDRSITSYKVSVNADGVTYQPKTGSIAYDQMVPIGQFTIGESSTTRSISTKTLGDTAPIDKKIFPKKK